MIDHSKNVYRQVKNISSARATYKLGPLSKKKIKLTKYNKAFLRAIGLLK